MLRRNMPRDGSFCAVFRQTGHLTPIADGARRRQRMSVLGIMPTVLRELCQLQL
jgi:hypothetical protein